MSFATVYNTLDALAKLRLVGSLRLGAAVRFDPNVAPHHHAVCDACGTVIDIPAPDAPTDAVKRRVEEAAGFEVRAEERTYRGLCGRCQRIASSRPRPAPTDSRPGHHSRAVTRKHGAHRGPAKKREAHREKPCPS